ncbi:TIGR04255 family protein [Acidobacteria bacterium AH-259-L09]|nr:TIGR04255 family protein [Acidobacteria bacterium AH-259-L09]
MAEPRHLQNAPIIEAIIDFRVKLHAGFQAEQFSDLEERLRDRFPEVKRRNLLESHFGVKEGKPIPPTTKYKGLYGFFFKSEDGRSVAQFRTDGFTFSRLKPYTKWERVFPEAYELWNSYVELASPEFITRIGVRYINRLNIPVPIKEFTQYLTAPPTVPEGLPRAVGNFLTRLVISEPETGIATNITQALEKVESDFATIILDIDTYKKKEFEIDDESIKPTFEKLREIKNRVFFSSITEDTVRLFE